MKKLNRVKNYAIMAAIAGTAALTTSSQAALLLYEGFDYKAGDLDGKGSGADLGWTGSWTGLDGKIEVKDGTLQHPAALPAVGGHAEADGDGGIYQRGVEKNVFKNLEQVGGVVWTTFIADFDNDGFAKMSFNMGHRNANFGLNHDGATHTLVLGDNVVEIGENDFPPGADDRLYKFKLTRIKSTINDVARFRLQLFAPNVPTPEADLVEIAAVTENLRTFGQDSNKFIVAAEDVEFDEIRIGEFDPDVELVPEPASMAALALGGLGLLRRKRRNS